MFFWNDTSEEVKSAMEKELKKKQFAMPKINQIMASSPGLEQLIGDKLELVGPMLAVFMGEDFMVALKYYLDLIYFSQETPPSSTFRHVFCPGWMLKP